MINQNYIKTIVNYIISEIKNLKIKLNNHISNIDNHVTATEKNAWNNTKTNLLNHTNNNDIHITLADKINLLGHIKNNNIHVTSEDRDGWNNNVKIIKQSLTDDEKYQARKNIGATRTCQEIMLWATSWNNTTKRQSRTVIGVSSNESEQEITPIPTIASQTAYYEAGIRCTNQGINSLTFTAEQIPTTDLKIYVIIQEVDGI